MSGLVLRGRTLFFKRRPHDLNDHASYDYQEDGVLAIEGGIIQFAGSSSALPRAFCDWPMRDHRPALILPGFIDPHIHFPQVQVVASYAPDLLSWLNRYTFVEEQKYSDLTHSARMASLFFDELLRNGTTSAAIYCAVYKQSAEALFREAEKRHLRMIAGKVMMDRHAPPALTDNPQSSYDDSKSLIERWHGVSRLAYAITPRFAITSTPEQLAMAQALVREYPDCYCQTHLSETLEEIRFVQDLFPGALDYTDVYDSFGLLGDKSLLGHAIHLSERERRVLSDYGSVAVHCPTSNLFLGSGLYDLFMMTEGATKVRTAIATDIGGGTSYSLLKTLDEAYKVQQLRRERLNPFLAFYYATLGNAEALSWGDRLGRFEVGYEADLVVLDARATPAMALRYETVSELVEELFLLQTMGDDRSVLETYVAGVASKPGKSC